MSKSTKKYEQLEVEYSTVELPPKATADDSHAFIISDVESGVENTHVRWDPQNQQMRIWSTNLPKAKLLLREKLESLKLTTAKSPLVRTVPKVKEMNAKQARAKNLEASVHIQGKYSWNSTMDVLLLCVLEICYTSV